MYTFLLHFAHLMMVWVPARIGNNCKLFRVFFFVRCSVIVVVMLGVWTWTTKLHHTEHFDSIHTFTHTQDRDIYSQTNLHSLAMNKTMKNCKQFENVTNSLISSFRSFSHFKWFKLFYTRWNKYISSKRFSFTTNGYVLLSGAFIMIVIIFTFKNNYARITMCVYLCVYDMASGIFSLFLWYEHSL